MPPPPLLTSSTAVDLGTLALVSRFYEFDYYLRQLKEADPPMALACVKQYVELAKGPKNKRRVDKPIANASVSNPEGVLSVLVNFLGGHVGILESAVKANEISN